MEEKIHHTHLIGKWLSSDPYEGYIEFKRSKHELILLSGNKSDSFVFQIDTNELVKSSSQTIVSTQSKCIISFQGPQEIAIQYQDAHRICRSTYYQKITEETALP